MDLLLEARTQAEVVSLRPFGWRWEKTLHTGKTVEHTYSSYG